MEDGLSSLPKDLLPSILRELPQAAVPLKNDARNSVVSQR